MRKVFRENVREWVCRFARPTSLKDNHSFPFFFPLSIVGKDDNGT